MTNKLRVKAKQSNDQVAQAVANSAAKKQEELWKDDTGPIDQCSTWCLEVDELIKASESLSKDKAILQIWMRFPFCRV